MVTTTHSGSGARLPVSPGAHVSEPLCGFFPALELLSLCTPVAATSEDVAKSHSVCNNLHFHLPRVRTRDDTSLLVESVFL